MTKPKTKTPRAAPRSVGPQPPMTGRTQTIPDGALPYEVTVHLSHATNRSDRDGTLTLEVTCPRTSRRLLGIELDSVALATLLTRSSAVAASLDFVNLDALGWHWHHETVLIPDDKENASANMDAFEHDGWKMVRNDYGNHHRREQLDGVWHFRVLRRRLMPEPMPRTTPDPLRTGNHQRSALFGVALDVAVKQAPYLSDDDRAYHMREFVKRIAATGRSE